MCRILGVKTNNYYSYQKRNASKVDDPTHQEMIDLVKDIAKFSDNTYGERRIKAVLNALSFPVSRWNFPIPLDFNEYAERCNCSN